MLGIVELIQQACLAETKLKRAELVGEKVNDRDDTRCNTSALCFKAQLDYDEEGTHLGGGPDGG